MYLFFHLGGTIKIAIEKGGASIESLRSTAVVQKYAAFSMCVLVLSKGGHLKYLGGPPVDHDQLNVHPWFSGYSDRVVSFNPRISSTEAPEDPPNRRARAL
ncbi:hypothetical protein TNCV_436471 [Trichonephila clavipes]|nr:hypothetical protein TNCV_436471 [Trichonephila clavipes]